MNLPLAFTETLQTLLGDEAAAFFAAFDAPRTWGLRVNTLKEDVPSFIANAPFGMRPVAWTRDGFHLNGEDAPGKHPYYHAGLYYLQDPSAMLPAEILNPQPGDRVLDLCAAPGGKTVQLAAMMKNTGFLLANDISPKRVKPLRRNLEGLGVANAIVSNASPEVLTAVYPSFFDKILLDVPCSGEGMFRKDDMAVRSWKRHDARELQALQRDIMSKAWTMLKPGGHLVYSTCTFNPEENERNIAWALSHFSDMQVEPVPLMNDLSPGRGDWAGVDALNGAVRIWPHLAEGEGHFAVLLQKTGEERGDLSPETFTNAEVHSLEEDTLHLAGQRAKSLSPAEQTAVIEGFRHFCVQQFSSDVCMIGSHERLSDKAAFYLQGALLYRIPSALSGHLARLNTPVTLEMPGLCLGEIKNGRYEPSAALLHALQADGLMHVVMFTMAENADLVRRYLYGETLMVEGEKGWTAILVDGFPLGWGKQEDGNIKNGYPKGWRMQ